MEAINTGIRTHHPYSPSSLQSLEACPCFKSRENNHIRSIMGTISHRVVETGQADLRLSDEDAAAAAECIDFYDRRLELARLAREQDRTTLSLSSIPQILEFQ